MATSPTYIKSDKKAAKRRKTLKRLRQNGARAKGVVDKGFHISKAGEIMANHGRRTGKTWTP